eukprot:TRINITY_DN42328_c0_g1_i1.p1 TRINITY_DN42328_c0_g1~~TRINITY_DN42328_c0_g1_i1.p1  ORF type:complete len:492 (-),score=104.04 TRINITY_DN42328_c0_g1_i1:69-1544(-)
MAACQSPGSSRHASKAHTSPCGGTSFGDLSEVTGSSAAAGDGDGSCGGSGAFPASGTDSGGWGGVWGATSGSGYHSSGTSNGCSSWDLSQAPVLLAGVDGKMYETRPTASLARDLAVADAEASAPLPTAAARRPNPADERPLRPCYRSVGGGGYASSPGPVGGRGRGAGGTNSLGGGGASGSVGSGSGAGGAVGPADRQVGGFMASKPIIRKRASCGTLPSSPSTPARPAAAVDIRRRGSPNHGNPPPAVSRPSTSSVGGGCGSITAASATAALRRSGRPYTPVDVLIGMGFDEDMARVAIAAAGGDVNRAVRIVLEDAKAHDARTACEWEFEGDSGWAPFDLETGELLGKALERGDAFLEVNNAGRRYLVDLDALTQVNLASKKTRRIRRRADMPGAASSSSSAPAGNSFATQAARAGASSAAGPGKASTCTPLDLAASASSPNVGAGPQTCVGDTNGGSSGPLAATTADTASADVAVSEVTPCGPQTVP